MLTSVAMPIEQSQAYCQVCQRSVMVERAAPNHLIHALVTLFTCFTWGIVWIFVSLARKPWRCKFCGSSIA